MKTHEQLKEFVESLCADEVATLMDLLPSSNHIEKSNQKIIKRERKTTECAQCKSISVARNGTKDGRKRYYCMLCQKSFSDSNESIVFVSRNNYDQ